MNNKQTVAIIAILCLIVSCNSKKAILVFNSSTISLDTVIVGQTKSSSFIIRNSGNNTLTIEKFSCSCECTVPELKENRKIDPFDSLNVKITVKGFEDDKDKWKQVLCTFKSNSDSVFSRLKIVYYTKSMK